MLEIKTTGVEQYLDGSGNMKLMAIGGPGAGKTRWSSFWPRPFYLDCEDGLASVADRAVPFVRVKSSKDMLDALEYLKGLERTPKPQRKYQTVIVDTADSFQRIVKNEWLEDTKAGVFTGYDAWGYLDSKMGMLLTRLLNLDYNVIVLVHYKEKDNDGTKEYGLQLQGETKTTIFNDFSLVGWLGTYWEAEDGQRVQKRGLTFQPTPDKDFLKDRLHATPKWMPVTLTSEQDYQQLWDAVFANPVFDTLGDGEVVDQVPDSEQQVVSGPVAPASTPGGPVPPRAPVAVPLDKMLKGELLKIANEELGLGLPDNTLKAELLTAIETERAKRAAAPTTPAEPAPAPDAPAATSTEGVPGGEAGASAPSEVGASDPTPSPSPTTEASPADAAAASHGSDSADTASGTSAPTEPQPVGEQMSTEQVAEALGATVISEEKNDTPSPQPATPPTPAAKPSAPQGPSVCADCGDDLTEEWNDPAKRDYVRLGFVKHRRFLDEKCRDKANGK